jgi:hypothetical protein
MGDAEVSLLEEACRGERKLGRGKEEEETVSALTCPRSHRPHSDSVLYPGSSRQSSSRLLLPLRLLSSPPLQPTLLRTCSAPPRPSQSTPVDYTRTPTAVQPIQTSFRSTRMSGGKRGGGVGEKLTGCASVDDALVPPDCPVALPLTVSGCPLDVGEGSVCSERGEVGEPGSMRVCLCGHSRELPLLWTALGSTGQERENEWEREEEAPAGIFGSTKSNFSENGQVERE